MPDATPTARDILIDARALIAIPQAWTQGTGARDADGEPIGVEHDDAVSWCATGAINCAVYRDDLWRRVRSGEVALQDLADLRGKTLLCHCRPKLPCHGDVLARATQWAAIQLGRTS